MRDLGCEVNPYISVKIYSTHAMKGIRLFNYFGSNFSNDIWGAR